jgi:hypothetical protein
MCVTRPGRLILLDLINLIKFPSKDSYQIPEGLICSELILDQNSSEGLISDGRRINNRCDIGTIQKLLNTYRISFLYFSSEDTPQAIRLRKIPVTRSQTLSMQSLKLEHNLHATARCTTR